MGNLKITNRVKFIRAIVILAIILISILIIFINKSYSNSETKYTEEYVIKGETLWSIAEKQIEENKYFYNKDIRNVVYELKQINNMKTSEINEGMKIKIPTY